MGTRPDESCRLNVVTTEAGIKSPVHGKRFQLRPGPICGYGRIVNSEIIIEN
jgi:hypothetical protein